MFRHSVPLSTGEMRGGNTVYRHSGPLSKGQRGGGNTVYKHSDISVNVRGEVNKVYTHSGPLL